MGPYQSVLATDPCIYVMHHDLCYTVSVAVNLANWALGFSDEKDSRWSYIYKRF